MKKIKLTLIAIIAMLVVSETSVYASFPVKKETKKAQVTEQTSVSSTVASNSLSNTVVAKKTEVAKKAVAGGMDEDMIITIVLWAFLGWLAGHRWYKGKPLIWNVLFIITAGGCGIWWVIDLINILQGNF
jgi:hypothetical protein